MSTRTPFAQSARRTSGSLKVVVGSLVVACLQLAGCGGKKTPAPEVNTRVVNEPVKSGARSKTGTTKTLKAKLKFKDAAGQTAFSLKPQTNGVKLVDGQERELARFQIKGSKLKIKDAQDNVVGYVNASKGKYKVKAADGKADLWQLELRPDGSWKLEDSQGQLVYRIKKRDYGFEIEDGAKTSQFKVKVKAGKTSLRDAAEKTLYSTRGQVSAIAVSCLGLTAIDSLTLRSGLLTMIAIRGGG